MLRMILIVLLSALVNVSVYAGSDGGRDISREPAAEMGRQEPCGDRGGRNKVVIGKGGSEKEVKEKEVKEKEGKEKEGKEKEGIE